jgi:hypothetical protein
MTDIVERDQTQTPYVVADATGKIMMWGSIPQFMIEYQTTPAGGSVVPGEGMPETHYVKDGQVLERPANPAVLDGMTLRNLPVPCVVMINAASHDCTDETVELSFSQPGTYPVVVSAFPALEATFMVTQEATAA